MKEEDVQSVCGIQDTATSGPTQSLKIVILLFLPHTSTKRRIHTSINQVYCREYHLSMNKFERPSSKLRIRANQVRRRGGLKGGRERAAERMGRGGARGNGNGRGERRNEKGGAIKHHLCNSPGPLSQKSQPTNCA